MHPLGRPASDGAHLAIMPCVRPRSPSHAQCVLLLCIRALQVTHSDNSIRAVDHYVHTARQLFKVHKANASTASAEQVIASVPKYGGRGGVLSLPHNSPVLSPGQFRHRPLSPHRAPSRPSCRCASSTRHSYTRPLSPHSLNSRAFSAHTLQSTLALHSPLG